MKKIKLIIRKIKWYFSKKDLNAILKYDPLDVLKQLPATPINATNIYIYLYLMYKAQATRTGEKNFHKKGTGDMVHGPMHRRQGSRKVQRGSGIVDFARNNFVLLQLVIILNCKKTLDSIKEYVGFITRIQDLFLEYKKLAKHLSLSNFPLSFSFGCHFGLLYLV